MIKKFLEAMDEDREYDFIANNYVWMTKEDLKSILLEYIYAVHSIRSVDATEVQEQVRDELETREIFG